MYYYYFHLVWTMATRVGIAFPHCICTYVKKSPSPPFNKHKFTKEKSYLSMHFLLYRKEKGHHTQCGERLQIALRTLTCLSFLKILFIALINFSMAILVVSKARMWFKTFPGNSSVPETISTSALFPMLSFNPL